tara:strand:- start:276 stop:503 length:228 start_codon:yes stop_codon:yes gene_type:complete
MTELKEVKTIQENGKTTYQCPLCDETGHVLGSSQGVKRRKENFEAGIKPPVGFNPPAFSWVVRCISCDEVLLLTI